MKAVTGGLVLCCLVGLLAGWAVPLAWPAADAEPEPRLDRPVTLQLPRASLAEVQRAQRVSFTHRSAPGQEAVFWPATHWVAAAPGAAPERP